MLITSSIDVFLLHRSILYKLACNCFSDLSQDGLIENRTTVESSPCLAFGFSYLIILTAVTCIKPGLDFRDESRDAANRLAYMGRSGP